MKLREISLKLHLLNYKKIIFFLSKLAIRS